MMDDAEKTGDISTVTVRVPTSFCRRGGRKAVPSSAPSAASATILRADASPAAVRLRLAASQDEPIIGADAEAHAAALDAACHLRAPGPPRSWTT
jgi:hypothetical protein